MRHLLLLFLFSGTASGAFAQRDSLPAAQPPSPVSVFTVGTLYGNTANYYGRNPDDNLPYMLLYAGYSFKSGFALSSSVQKLLSNGSGISAVDLYAGYSFKISKNATGNFGYTHYFFQKNSPLLQSANDNVLSSNLTYNWFIKSGISASYAFGTENDVFLSFRNSRVLGLGKLFSEKDYISLEPAVDVYAGTVHFFETYTERRDQRRQEQNKPPPRPPVTTTIESASFGMMAYTFSLPLIYSKAKYSIEATYQTSLSGQKFSSGTNASGSLFSLGFYYSF